MINRLRETFEYHFDMLGDGERLAAYATAIGRTVRPGDVVVDIGTGTGILALLALRAGARAVYAIEGGPAAHLARKVIPANDPDGRVTLIEGVSHDVDLPEPADVLVSEILWNAGLGEGILATYADARARLLKPDARIVPARLEMWLAPLEAPKAHEVVDVWSRGVAGLDYSCLRREAADLVFVRRLQPECLLAAPASVGAVDLTAPLERTFFAGAADFQLERDGTLHGLAGWFRAELAPGVVLENPPPGGGHWGQAYFPVQDAVALAAGDAVRAQVAVLSDDELWQWTVRAGGRTQKGSTLTPMLAARPR